MFQKLPKKDIVNEITRTLPKKKYQGEFFKKYFFFFCLKSFQNFANLKFYLFVNVIQKVHEYDMEKPLVTKLSTRYRKKYQAVFINNFIFDLNSTKK